MAENASDDDWETLDDTGELDRQISALEKKATRSTPDPDSLTFGRVTIMQNNDQQRSQYTPTITLLKRDPKESVSSQTGMGDRKPSYKTLQQREAEYAEARKRILGDNEASSEPVGILTSEISPKLAQRTKPETGEKRESVVTRQPITPSSTTNGFQVRTKSIDSGG